MIRTVFRFGAGRFWQDEFRICLPLVVEERLGTKEKKCKVSLRLRERSGEGFLRELCLGI